MKINKQIYLQRHLNQCRFLSKFAAHLRPFRSNENKAYQLKVGTEKIIVYCHLSRTDLGACGAGGWTLVMKIDGTKVMNNWIDVK